MTIPDETFYDPTPAVDKNRPPIRTKENVHICGDSDDENDDYPEDVNPFPSPSPSPRLFGDQMSPCLSSTSCHTHSLEFVTAPSPAEVEMFGRLRGAVLRAFNGEELPRGQKAGPFWFGSADSGYTVGYKFELTDDFARGKRRVYALLALAGNDIQRALAAATVLWALFEQIALNITRAAQEISDRTHMPQDNSPPEEEVEELILRQGVRSFLTNRRALGNLSRVLNNRSGVVDLKPTSIAELVENERFFCELHMVFVGILQELGRSFGGMQVRAPDEIETIEGQVANLSISTTNKAATSSRKDEDWRSRHPYPPTPTSMTSTSHAVLNASAVTSGAREVAV